MPAEPPGVRAGCLVVSYSSLTPRQPDGMFLAEMREHVVATAHEWAHEYGLLSTEGELVSVQVRALGMTESLALWLGA